MSENRIDIVLQLKAKIYRLISSYESLKKENAEARERVEKLELELASKEKDLKILRNENEKLRLAKAFTSSDESQTAKLQISKIVREIDKCIALLNK